MRDGFIGPLYSKIWLFPQVPSLSKVLRSRSKVSCPTATSSIWGTIPIVGPIFYREKKKKSSFIKATSIYSDNNKQFHSMVRGSSPETNDQEVIHFLWLDIITWFGVTTSLVFDNVLTFGHKNFINFHYKVGLY